MDNQEKPTSDGESSGPRVKSFESSDKVDKLFSALSKAQSEMGVAKKDSNNPFFNSKYANFPAIVEVVRGPFGKHGLCHIEMPLGGFPVCRTSIIIGHESGQWISGIVENKPDKVNPQGMGSARTYNQRQGLQGAAGVAADDDDDGNAASQPPARANPASVNRNDKRTVTMPQLKRLRAIASNKGWSDDMVKESLKKDFGLTSSKELTREQYDKLVNTIEGAPQ